MAMLKKENRIEKLGLPKGYRPLAANKDIVYLYHAGYIVLYNWNKQTWNQKILLEKPGWKDCCRLLVRLFRREPRTAIYKNGKLVLVWKRSVYSVDLNTGRMSLIQNPKTGFSSPLQLCPATDGDIYQVYWGDYGPNSKRLEVNIYGLAADGKVNVIYTFAKGQVRHIHGIVQDGTKGYYIFTGDNEPNAGIYHADLSFSKVEPVACGDQQYRAVVGFPTEQGLLYATDAVNEPNHIYLLSSEGTLQVIMGVNGSCIYGSKYRGGYLFSTTVEPDERNQGLLSWISYKRGQGILSDRVQLIFVDVNMRPSILTELKKDLFPMKLLQYGCIQFAEGKDETAFLYPVAVRKYDGLTLQLRADEQTGEK